MGYNQAIPAEKGLPMPAPEIVKQLVENFELHRREYLAGKYNETQLRREFLDPFFEALGWDIFNRLGYSEQNKHVIHEDALEVEGIKKAPDYAFKVGRERKFFCGSQKAICQHREQSRVCLSTAPLCLVGETSRLGF
jgi:hypothetical protein